jgi:hypothetical protein
VEYNIKVEKSIISSYREKLLKIVPGVADYISTFNSINKRWGGAITSALIEIGHMDDFESRQFGPLIEEMSSTKKKYSNIQKLLVDAILFEMVRKVDSEIGDAAKFTINILKRNLFERTADVGYLATDAEIINFLIFIREEQDETTIRQKENLLRKRLEKYQYEYTVYNEIIILDTEGNVRANLDTGNKITFSCDPLLKQTQVIDLHGDAADKYIETFRPTDLKPGHGNVLVYSQKIENPDTGASLGTLCLCFDFEDEMNRIFENIKYGNEGMIVAILDGKGTIISSNCSNILSVDSTLTVRTDSDLNILSLKNKTYFYRIVPTDGYQGFYGLNWYGLAMIDAETAFNNDSSVNKLDNSIFQKLRNSSSELASIKDKSEDLLSFMTTDSINGQINAAKSDAAAFVEILHFIEWIGSEINKLFNSAIMNLQKTVVTSLFNDVRFRAFQANNIADRNLYERANDVCWWALTPMFQFLMAKHFNNKLNSDDLHALTSNLQYINDLYTPYLRIVLADTTGKIIAVSNPPEVLHERFTESNLPKGQEFVGMQLEPELLKKALSLKRSKDYCVSDFGPSLIYGGRPTYVYSTAVRDPNNERRIVGVIQIVFDAEPQFYAMLNDVLPKDENKQIVPGSFGIFADRKKYIIASTNPEFPAGEIIDLDDSLFKYKNGQRASDVIEIEDHTYIVGIQVSNGYREFKLNDGYTNDIICMIFVPV